MPASNELIVYVLFAAILNLIIFYLIIKAAVSSALDDKFKNLERQLKVANRMKRLELLEKGIDPDKIQKEIATVFSP